MSPIAAVPEPQRASTSLARLDQIQLQETSLPIKVPFPRLSQLLHFSDQDTAKAETDDHSASDFDDYVEASSTVLSGGLTTVEPALFRTRPFYSWRVYLPRKTVVCGAGDPYSKVKGSNNLHDCRSPYKRPLHKNGCHS